MKLVEAARWAGRAVLVLLLASLILSQVLAAQDQDLVPEFLLLEVRLDQSVLSGAIPAYEVGEHVLLPLGELSRLLTIAIHTKPLEGIASGYILSEDRGFSLNLNEARVTRAGVTESFDPTLVMAEPDDLYVPITLLESWLPLAFEVHRSSLSVRVHALEELPLQSRLKRERLGERAERRGPYQDPGYPHHRTPYRLLSMPVVDQTVSTELRRNDYDTQTDTRYTAFLAGDLLGMQSSLYFSTHTQDPSSEVRATLGRHDPDAQLLGPLRARSYKFGSLSAPAVDNVTRGISGNGVTLSNRPLKQPTSFDRQTFEGDLPPGWDVELYYNDALVNFQQARADGRYRFESQPLSYGRNDFRLVFNGPLGQTRVERSSFSLAQSMVPPGDFRYSLTEHRDDEGQPRSVAKFDLGIARNLSASAGFIRAPMAEDEQQFTTLGLRTFWQSLSVSTDLVQDGNGGSLAELAMQTRLGGMAVDASRAHLDAFSSDLFPDHNDPIRTRDEIRLSGSLPLSPRARLPVTVTASRDERVSGNAKTDISARISAYAYRTAFTNTLRWQSFGEDEHASGRLQISRRIRDMSLRSQINYTLGSERALSSLAVSADKSFAEGYRMTLGAHHAFDTTNTRYSAGFTKRLGRYGLGLSASYADTGEFAVGAQLFVAMGRDPRRSDWLFDAQPMANSSAVSARLFLDENNNGVMDTGEEPLQDAGFIVNGGGHQARTDASGIAYIDRLPINQHVDIGVDTSTLIDPQWEPQLPGLRLVPRPGNVVEMEFPVRMTSEIDGTVYLLDKHGERGIGDLKLELLNSNHEIIAKTVSSWDGFYIIPSVAPGNYWLRASSEQLRRLGLGDTGLREVTVPKDGTFVSGIDLWTFASSYSLPDRSTSEHSAGLMLPEYKDGFRTEAWVLAQSPAVFTIQLIAVSTEAAAQQYIARHGLTDQAAYMLSTHTGSALFSVVYGRFSTYQEAREAEQDLLPTLREAKPWPRRFDELQAIIRKSVEL